MRCDLDNRSRSAYKTKEHGTVYTIDGTQDFEIGHVIVWVDNKRGYVSCPLCYIEGNSGHEIGFMLDKEFVYFSHFLQGDLQCDYD